jgi:replicative DNA helicase
VGVLAGLKNIDNNLYGLEARCTYYVAATRSTGKSALALNIASNIANYYPGWVLYFTLESTLEALTFRRFARDTKIALTRLKRGGSADNPLDNWEWEKITNTSNTLSESRLVVIEKTKYLQLENLTAFCETFTLEQKLRLVVVDYMQLLTAKGRFSNRHLELSHISRRLNALAKDLDCPIMVLSQLNKEKGLKESGDLENNADHIWLLEKLDPDQDYIHVKGVKAKDSAPWDTWLTFNGNIMTFYDCDHEPEDYKAAMKGSKKGAKW